MCTYTYNVCVCVCVCVCVYVCVCVRACVCVCVWLTKSIASFEAHREETFNVAPSSKPLFLRASLRPSSCGTTTANTAFCSNL